MNAKRIIGIILIAIGILWLALGVWSIIAGILNPGGNTNFILGPILGILWILIAAGHLVPGAILTAHFFKKR